MLVTARQWMGCYNNNNNKKNTCPQNNMKCLGQTCWMRGHCTPYGFKYIWWWAMYGNLYVIFTIIRAYVIYMYAVFFTTNWGKYFIEEKIRGMHELGSLSMCWNTKNKNSFCILHIYCSSKVLLCVCYKSVNKHNNEQQNWVKINAMCRRYEHWERFTPTCWAPWLLGQY